MTESGILTVTYSTVGSERRVSGLVLSQNEALVLVAEFTDFEWDGLSAIRAEHCKVEKTDFDMVCERVLRRRGSMQQHHEWVAREEKSIITMLEFILSIPKQRYVSLETEDSDFYIGAIRKCASGSVFVCELNTDGSMNESEWTPVPIEKLVRVRFDTAYLKGYEELRSGG